MPSKPESPVHHLGLNLITADLEIQSRIEMIPQHQKDIFDGILSGNIPPPVIIYFDGYAYWLADGFHRYGAYRALAKTDPVRFGQIRAEIREGSREDAVIHSAGANQFASWPRTLDCKRKAVRMLLDIPAWRGKSCGLISKHTGVGVTSVARWRAEYFHEKGISPPSVVEGQDGEFHRVRKGRDQQRSIRIKSKDDGFSYYYARIGGREVYLCAVAKGRDFAEAMFREKLASVECPDLQLGERANVGSFLRNAMVVTEPILPTGEANRLPGLMARQGDGFVVTWTDFGSSDAAVKSIGRLVVAREVYRDQRSDPDAECRMILICRPWDGPVELIEIGKSLGVEFLTPKQVVQSCRSGSLVIS